MRINQFFYWGCIKTTVNRMMTESNEKNKNNGSFQRDDYQNEEAMRVCFYHSNNNP